MKSFLPLGLFALASASLGNAANLSPAQWPAEERERIEAFEQGTPWPDVTRVVEGKSGLVSATGSPLAVRAGLEALKQGGTAADAAVTVALTQVMTAFGSIVSYAGIMQLTYYDAKTDKVYSLNAGWGSYHDETDPKSIPAANDLGAGQGRKTLVPGFMAGIEAMHQRFGVLPFADLFEPAIWYADNGIEVSPMSASYFSSRQPFLRRTPEGRAFLGQAGGSLPAVGERFIQPELARTLRAVAQHGAQFMYTGDWGREFVAAVQREGGKVTLEDMNCYQPIWEEPLHTEFGGHLIYGPGRSSLGGYSVLEAMNLIEELKIDRMNPYWKDPKTFQGLARVLELVQITVYQPSFIADAAGRDGIRLLPEDRATKAYAKAVIPFIDRIFNVPQTSPTTAHSHSIVIIDRWGNVASLVHSINTVLWGTTGIVVGGVPLSDAAAYYQTLLAALTPGDRFPNQMAPIIVTTAGRPSLAVASIGRSLLPETVRLLLGSLGNHLDAQTIMAAPPLLNNFDYSKRGMIQVPKGRYDQDFLTNLRAAGLTIRIKFPAEVMGLGGTAVIGTISAESGLRQSVEIAGLYHFADGY
jgi:gamma-glutamyltranspeptidase/glutathione hydrolase